MAKNSITDYDNIAANNTDIQSVDIDEGCAPSGINNAIRELMADLADVNDGTVPLASPDINGGTIDGVTIGGTTAGAGTFTAFTSNGIDDNATSNAVTIDSSGNVGIGTSPSNQLHLYGTAPTIRIQDSLAAHYATVSADNASGSLALSADAGNTGSSTSITFNLDGTERARLDASGNVGIGTSSPYSFSPSFNFLDINGTKGGALVFTRGTNSTTNQFMIRTSDDDALRFEYGSTFASESMRILSSGLVGVGTTAPETYFQAEGSGFNRGVIRARATSTTYASNILDLRCSTVNSSNYNMIIARSNNVNDNEFIVTGAGLTKADGGFQTGADYAEYFEWDDGNSNDEDRRGYSVVLTNGNKIRKATSSDTASDIIGVISGHPSVVGDAAWASWSGKFNRDDFGSYIWEAYTLTEWTEADGTEHSYQTDQIPSDVTAPSDATVITQDNDGNTLKRKQVNLSYDDTQTYTPRENRQEWDAVGMVGKLRMRSGQPTGDRWIKMRDIATDDNGNVTVEEWLVR